ncbi:MULTISPECIES: ribbon-helix-helix protein, CopG family [Nostoc]|uniref:Ribbon-helix-helix protein, CopG family n=1 Tax=Nostoc paludosum FACHB-159 TaxID=2692908 RepID=A0ABR8KLS3_9NOSO|nr:MULTISPECIES: ribbon-helix-helix protein, CopG family [Nostoc]MBD2683227.1 ribbon-helix-helix protein, CopG family [Nostoc sp. FACHB-857]MBD2739554.1 ribbon-helix-helix protein, CopG family [Nostoc paludosum FACHB-159]
MTSITFRCPDDLASILEARAEAKGVSKSKIIIEMLRGKLPALPLSDRKKLPEVSAIYLVWSAEGKLLYIGRTVNLKNRWLNHHRLQDLALMGVDKVFIAWFETDKERLPEIEQTLIDNLEPTLNGSKGLITKSTTSIKIPVTLNHDIYTKLQKLSAANGLSMAAQIRYLITQASNPTGVTEGSTRGQGQSTECTDNPRAHRERLGD